MAGQTCVWGVGIWGMGVICGAVGALSGQEAKRGVRFQGYLSVCVRARVPALLTRGFAPKAGTLCDISGQRT